MTGTAQSPWCPCHFVASMPSKASHSCQNKSPNPILIPSPPATLYPSSLVFLHFPTLPILSAPGPLHILCPLCEILPIHFSRLKPRDPLSPVFHLFRELSFPSLLIRSHDPNKTPSSPPLLSCHSIKDYRIHSCYFCEVHESRDYVYLVPRCLVQCRNSVDT